MRYKDAAYEILKLAKNPLHYNEITEQALAGGLLQPGGETPHQSMGALLYTDTLKPVSRFKRGEVKGTFALIDAPTMGIQQQIEAIEARFRKEMRERLRKIPPEKFEELIRALLEEMEFEDTVTTPYSGDKGVDVRGVLRANQLSATRVAIQAKRWLANVGSNVVREMRGSLRMAEYEQGLIITPSDFSEGAKEEAIESGKMPISLINGAQLVDLLISYGMGVKNQTYNVPTFDEEYWTEVLGVTPEVEKPKPEPANTTKKYKFPIPVQATFKGITYHGELLDIKGKFSYAGKIYPTPTTAAKLITTTWKEVNGWLFWRYENPLTGKWEPIGWLREK